MPFRNGKPARLGKVRPQHSSEAISYANDFKHVDSRTGLRESIQVLTHQQIVSRSLLHRQRSYPPAFPEDPELHRKHLAGTSSSPLNDEGFDPQASSSGVNSIVRDIESRIDVEQTIAILQELKKSASPQDLVALHRALLPLKDDDPTHSPHSATQDPAYTSSPSARESSAPPSLSTRTLSPEDVSRKPRNPATIDSPHQSRRRRQTRELKPPAKRHLEGSPTRCGTPLMQNFHAGAFAPGTLRITNGAASPEPSITLKQAGDSDMREEKDLDLLVDDAFPHQWPQNRQQVSLSACLEPSRPAGPRQRSWNPQPRGRSRIKDDMQLNSSPSQQGFEPTTRYSLSGQHPRFQQRWAQRASHLADEHLKFQVRWGHRANNLSREYLFDCVIDASPYEGQGMPDFAKPPGFTADNVYGNTPGNSDDCNAREKTLSKLSGSVEQTAAIDNNSIGAAQTNEEVLSASHSSLPIGHASGHNKDSGYCSGVPSFQLPRNLSSRGKSHEVSVIAERPGEKDLISHESHGLYTFEEMLTSTVQSNAVQEFASSSPIPPISPASQESAIKKSSPLSMFKTKANRQRSTGRFDAEPKIRAFDAFPRDSCFHTSSDDAQVEKQPRKLQKRIPDSVLHERKKTLAGLNCGKSEQSNDVTESRSATDTPSPSTRPSTAKPDFHLVLADEKKGSSSQNSGKPTTDIKDNLVQKRTKSSAPTRARLIAEHSGESPLTAVQPWMRSKSVPEANASISLPRVTDITASLNCIKAGSDSPVPEPRNQVRTNHPSAARALNSHPPNAGDDIKRSAQVPRGVHNRARAAYQVPSGEIQSTSPSSNQANSTALARDDFVVEEAHDSSSKAEQPPVPPPHINELNAPVTPVAIGSSCSVEDRFPEWQGRPASAKASATSPSWIVPVRQSNSLLELKDSVPPLPKLPADLQSKVSRADQMVAKKLKISPRSSPDASARSSLDSNEMQKHKRARNVAARKELDVKRAHGARKATLEQLSATQEEPAELVIEASGTAQRWSVDGSIQLPCPDDEGQSTFRSHDSQHPGWPSWEQQSSLWRQRRQGLVHLELASADGTASDSDNPVESPTAPTGPTIVFSRYITPLGADYMHNANDATHEEAGNAVQLAQSYSDLVHNDKENRPAKSDTDRTDSVTSAFTFATGSSVECRPAKLDISRSRSAESTYSAATTMTAGSRSSLSESRVDRALTVHNTDAKLSNIAAQRPSSSASHSKLLALPKRPNVKKSSSETLLDRYSGGLNYSWDRDAGFGGSAGTVASNSAAEKSNRKSVRMSEDFGLDLSDIPVFLRKA